jgi:hypothetical protein
VESSTGWRAASAGPSEKKVVEKANAKVVPSNRPPLFSSAVGVVPRPLAGLPVDLIRAPAPGVLRIYRQPSIGDD